MTTRKFEGLLVALAMLVGGNMILAHDHVPDHTVDFGITLIFLGAMLAGGIASALRS